ncbi:Tubulin-specific chaperone D [Lachnellula suecica]|uniref:Tubulin-specific chaperone D n=1 Tax=Lachnellula suecica TaxID=602035 RepID=A0A8T9CIU3_9HELO|nr:Tubulin-specific chaperone D [Lachnellula suecica]
MDAAADDADIKLQGASADLIGDLERSLKPFLWKTTKTKTKIRRRVRARETERLVALLEPFQEDPQLLDPHLKTLVPILADAFLAFLLSPPPKFEHSVDSTLLVPLSQSICRLLYTFCKVRGEKVIVQFLSTETRYLELLLSAIETGRTAGESWSWEERYITLLWLSQLLLAPFDLASISSADTVDTTQTVIPGLKWPANVPAVAMRVIPLAVRFLSSSSKERDAAKILLVRITMRRDMQELGILESLVNWAIFQLQPSDIVQQSYHYIGILSFISGVLVSSIGTTVMRRFLPSIFQLTQDISEAGNDAFKTIHDSAIGRKAIIKVLRSLAVLNLPTGDEDMLNLIIQSLLDYLADSATPVRLAASKALSMITLKVDPEMASQVVDAVVSYLADGLKWVHDPVNDKGFQLSNTNPLHWHGLILTLSHLLYRHSVPFSSLNDVLSYLTIGLSFEQRSTSGSSVGSNVRDASCFGIWALARRYSTAELSSVEINPVVLSGNLQIGSNVSVLQQLATQLVVSGCLDPAGNIRRGASAALQELIGRHPDTIEEGIRIVQVVDYHSVALRTRAIQETAPEAARLSRQYYEGLKLALLGWRGVHDNDVSVRRAVAVGLRGLIATRQTLIGGSNGWSDVLHDNIHDLPARFSLLPANSVGPAHGLVLCIASLVDMLKNDLNFMQLKSSVDADKSGSHGASGLRRLVHCLMLGETAPGSPFSSIFTSPDATFGNSQRSAPLLAEAKGRLIIAMCPVFRADIAFRWFWSRYGGESKSNIPNAADLEGVDKMVAALLDVPPLDTDSSLPSILIYLDVLEGLYADTPTDLTHEPQHELCLPEKKMRRVMQTIISETIALEADDHSMEVVAEAAVDLLLLMDGKQRSSTIQNWIQKAGGEGHEGHGKSYLRALFKAYPIGVTCQTQIFEVIQARWTEAQELHDTSTSKTILSSLAKSVTCLKGHPHSFTSIVEEGLDDYTIDSSRGDIGSLVRIEAAKAAAALWKVVPFNDTEELFGKILRVAVEKLDKVRAEGRNAIAAALTNPTPVASPSPEYFTFFLDLCATRTSTHKPPPWTINLFEGYVTSVHAGSEDVVRASRTALVDFCQNGNDEIVCDTVYNAMAKSLASSNDRVLVAALETMGFLFDMGIAQRTKLDLRALFILTQRAHYKTQNTKKIEAAVKLYGAMAGVYEPVGKKLEMMLRHTYPVVRMLVQEELFVVKGTSGGIS